MTKQQHCPDRARSGPFAALVLLVFGCQPIDESQEGPDTDAVVLNEICPYNRISPSGELEDDPQADWLELYNGTDANVSLEGYVIYYYPIEGNRRGTRLPRGLTVPSHGYLVLWADENLREGLDHLSFNLNREGGTLELHQPDGSESDQPVHYPPVPDDSGLHSYARCPTGTGDWNWYEPTPTRANTPTCP